MNGQLASLDKFRFNVKSCVSRFVMAVAMMFALTLFTSHAMQAQTFSVLYNFTGGADGSTPDAGVTIAPPGILYGTAASGGAHDAGTVFKLAHVNSSWVFSPLYEFTGFSDGDIPNGGVVIGPNDALYGTTQFGGGDNLGVVFALRPPATVCRSVTCYWSETVLHSFTGSPDGDLPQLENLAFDQAGDIYGTTYGGGTYGYGTVFELTPSGGGYTGSNIHSFNYPTGGTMPQAGVVLDTAGNVYGTTTYGGTGTECMYYCGTVFQLTPSSGGWTENVLVNFDGTNGKSPLASPILDASGNVYGTANVVYKLSPSGGGFTYSAIYTFNSICGYQSALVMDAAGNLYGVCQNGPGVDDYDGWVYELTNCSETCTVINLHSFGGSDGAGPWGTPALDANGNLYGTTVAGGTGNCRGAGCGVVWEIAGVAAPRKN